MTFGVQCWSPTGESVITTVQPMNLVGIYPVYEGRHTITIKGSIDGVLDWTFAFGEQGNGTTGVAISSVYISGNKLTYVGTKFTSLDIQSLVQKPSISVYIRR